MAPQEPLPLGQPVGEIRACERCGSPVVIQKTITGSFFYLPISDQYLSSMFKEADVDFFILDKLRHQEKLIAELKKKLGQKVRKHD